MIRNDFITGGFPVCLRAPIICILANSQLKIAYNRFDLKEISSKNKIELCFGVWPGKKTTDCFLIDPKAYTSHCPPERHKNIDSAENIIVQKDTEGNFIGISYLPFGETTWIVSYEPLLFDYIRLNGLKYTSSF